MKSQSLAKFLKSPLPFAVVAVAALAFLAAALISNRGVADESAPVAAPEPAATGWRWATPTHEEFSRDMEEFRAKQAADGNDGENRSGRSRVIMPPAPAPRSTAEAEAWAAPPGRSLYFAANDRVVHLPEGVRRKMWIPYLPCFTPDCPRMPVTVLQNENGTEIALDGYGEVLSEYMDVLDEFPFLKEE